VTAALDPLVAGLSARMSSAVSEPVAESRVPAVAKPAESRDAGVKLNALLSDLDPTAADFVETNHAALRPLFDGQSWPEFEKLVHGYAFADAQAQLQQALRSFAGSV
jgi:hypothetical protein